MARLLLLAALTAFASACLNGEPRLDFTAILWLPPEAKLEKDGARPVRVENGRSIYIDKTASIAFTFEGDRFNLSSRIVAHFSAQGWRQRRQQYLNPQLATSFYNGWQVHGGGLILGDGSDSLQRGFYRRWRGEWEDDRSNIVAYAIGGQGGQLRGLASYIPRHVVEAARRKLGR